MSRQSSSDTVHVVVPSDVHTEVKDFKNAYDIPSTGEAIALLYTIAEHAEIPVHEADVTDAMDAVDVEDVEAIDGFIVDDGEAGVHVIGTDNRKFRIITGVSEPLSAAQPMDRTKITTGRVICPACDSELLEYDLSDSYPGVQEGVFNDFSIRCDTCGSRRPGFTLFAAKVEAEPSPEAMKSVMVEYFAHLLILDGTSTDEFKRRIGACSTLAQDAGWEWLPDPEVWIGFSVSQSGKPVVTPERYVAFIKKYGSLLFREMDGVTVIAGDTAAPSGGDTADNVWQVHFATSGSDPTPGIEALEDLAEGWTSTAMNTTLDDSSAAGDYAVTVSLQGLPTID